MDLLLKILGYIFLALIILGVIAFFVIRHYWGKLKDFAAALEPIELEEDPNPDWTNGDDIRALISQFEVHGFRPFKVYKPTAIGIKPMILANDSLSMFGEIYVTKGETICGFSATTIDDMTLDVTTAKLGDTFGIKPNKITEAYPDATIAQLHEKILTLVGEAPLKEFVEDMFTEELQKQLNQDLLGMYDSHERPLWEDGEEVFVGRWRKHHKNEKDLHKTYELMASEHIDQIADDVSETLPEREDLSAAVVNRYESSNLIFQSAIPQEWIPRIPHQLVQLR
ncbi:MAG: hypothetical protein AAFX93_06725 [Verrucomicrobiota bacterium]